MGFVVNLVAESEFDKLRKISQVMDMTPVLTDELLELGKWLAEETISLYIQAYQAMLPQVLKAKYKKEIEALTFEELPKSLQKLFDGRTVISFDEFLQRNGNYRELHKEMKNGHVQIHYIVQSKETIKKSIVY